MKRLLALAALFAAAAPLAAFADDRMSDARYLQAARCVAYADLEQLSADGYRADALRAELGAQRRLHAAPVRNQARDAARDIRLAAQRAGDSDIALARLREGRDSACARFVPTGQVLIEGAESPT